MKKWWQLVPRSELARFASALANRFACGVYITTASFTRPARRRAWAWAWTRRRTGWTRAILRLFEAQVAGSAQARALAEANEPCLAAPVDDGRIAHVGHGRNRQA